MRFCTLAMLVMNVSGASGGKGERNGLEPDGVNVDSQR
jgi:hypothetical protein